MHLRFCYPRRSHVAPKSVHSSEFGKNLSEDFLNRFRLLHFQQGLDVDGKVLLGDVAGLAGIAGLQI